MGVQTDEPPVTTPPLESQYSSAEAELAELDAEMLQQEKDERATEARAVYTSAVKTVHPPPPLQTQRKQQTQHAPAVSPPPSISRCRPPAWGACRRALTQLGFLSLESWGGLTCIDSDAHSGEDMWAALRDLDECGERDRFEVSLQYAATGRSRCTGEAGTIGVCATNEEAKAMGTADYREVRAG
jgi:hypothetical protein